MLGAESIVNILLAFSALFVGRLHEYEDCRDCPLLIVCPVVGSLCRIDLRRGLLRTRTDCATASINDYFAGQGQNRAVNGLVDKSWRRKMLALKSEFESARLLADVRCTS
jgi:hypothetical protein